MHYFVFWIPTVNHFDNYVPQKKEIRITISDGGNDLIVELKLSDNLDCEAKFNCFDDIMKLNFIDKNNIGLFVYSIDIDNYQPWVVDAFRRPIYHGFKTFFHTHQHHKEEEDSILNAYFSKNLSDCDIKKDFDTDKNIIVKWYANQYKEKLVAYIHDILFVLQYTTEQMTKYPFRPLKKVKRIYALLEETNKALGEGGYSQILVKHVRNEDVAFDINNLIINIKTIQQRILHINSAFDIRVKFVIAIISWILSVLIICLGLFRIVELIFLS